MSGYRKIVVDGRQWKYKIGKNHCVANAIDNNEKRLIKLSELLGVSEHEFDRMRHKKTAQITPGMVAAWIGDRVYESHRIHDTSPVEGLNDLDDPYRSDDHFLNDPSLDYPEIWIND